MTTLDDPLIDIAYMFIMINGLHSVTSTNMINMLNMINYMHLMTFSRQGHGWFVE